MKILLTFMFIFLFSTVSFSQTEREKETYLPVKKMNKRIIKREFLEVPQGVRDCHGTGTLRLYVKVNEMGNVKIAKLLNGLCPKVNEYVEDTVSNWKFKPLTVDKVKISFKGMVEVPFCYGAFYSCY